MELPHNEDEVNATSIENGSQEAVVSAAVADMALRHSVQETGGEAKSYAEEVSDRVIAAQKSHREFVEALIEQGASDEELSTALANAMNEGAVPRIVVGAKYRGSGVSLVLLDGVVPAESLRVRVARSRAGGIMSIRTSLMPAAEELNDQDSFSYASTGLLPQSDSGDPVDAAMLAKIDAHFPLEEQGL